MHSPEQILQNLGSISKTLQDLARQLKPMYEDSINKVSEDLEIRAALGGERISDIVKRMDIQELKEASKKIEEVSKKKNKDAEKSKDNPKGSTKGAKEQ